jgi:predicted HTH domain antitoxin
MSEEEDLDAIIERYRNNEISLMRGAELAGEDLERFKEELEERGITVDTRTAEPSEKDFIEPSR